MCKTCRITDDPVTDVGEEVLGHILDACCDAVTGGRATVERDKVSGDTIISFYYRGDWTSLEPKLLKAIDLDDENIEYDTSEEAERKRWNETDEERDRREAEEEAAWLRKWEKRTLQNSRTMR